VRTVKTRIRITATSKTSTRVNADDEAGVSLAVANEELVNDSLAGARGGGLSKDAVKRSIEAEVRRMIMATALGYEPDYRQEMADAIHATITNTAGVGTTVALRTNHPTLVMRETGETVEGNDFIEAKNAKVMRIPIRMLVYTKLSAQEYVRDFFRHEMPELLDSREHFEAPASVKTRERFRKREGKKVVEDGEDAIYRKRVKVSRSPWARSAGLIARDVMVSNLISSIASAIGQERHA
jgi:hypothetical protein